MELSVAAMLTLTGGVLLLPVVAFIITFLFWPGALLRAYNWFRRQRLGMEVRYCHRGSYRFCYSSRGRPGGATPSLLFLHGFSANKDMWLPIINVTNITCFRPLNKDKMLGLLFASLIQAHFTKEDLQFFHYTLFLLSPVGLVYPTESKFISRLREMEKTNKQESIPLIPSTLHELDTMMKLCCHNPPNLPRQVQILRGFLANRIPDNDFYKEGQFLCFCPQSRSCLSSPGKLFVSQVLDVSGAAVIQKELPLCQVDILDDCGHSVALERPGSIAKLMMDFVMS
uniref:AB hydrolase-1 domain-containing protein n=1 Tax=Cyprinodon variegatus TaxID=28743 RepID=A0A3Q2D0J6_CYPVA